MTKIKTQLWLQITLNILLNFLEKQIILHFTKLNYLPGYTCKFNKILTPPPPKHTSSSNLLYLVTHENDKNLIQKWT